MGMQGDSIMKRWATTWILMLGLAVPVFGLDEDHEDAKKEGEAAKAAGQDKKDSPILRLAELRLDRGRCRGKQAQIRQVCR